MGIPGILKEVGKGERIALSKFAVEHLERTRRPLRIAIDIAIWQFQNQAGQGGKNPALRTLYFRLLKLLALPIHPVFVYDGKNRPLTKRNKSVKAYGTCISNEMSKKLVQACRFPCHVAPGEAEAECALLQKVGIVDAVMSQDVDAIMFGSTLTLRDWSKEGSRGNKAATHINVLRQAQIKELTGLDSEGMILVALLSGGDYNTDGLPGVGTALACEIARAGFGADLLELIRNEDVVGLQEWRARLQFELETNESGYFRRKHNTVKIPDGFPDRTILGYYTNPVVSAESDLLKLQDKWNNSWEQNIDIPALREYTADRFDWRYKKGAFYFIRNLAPVLLAHRLRRGMSNTTLISAESIKERRRHWINDGMPELRVEIIPANIVGLDLAAEVDNPASVEEEGGGDDENYASETVQPPISGVDESERAAASNTLRPRKSPPWDPFAPEKVYIPETIVQLGLPALVEEWQQKQREILADPKKFATRKCAKSKTARKTKDAGMRPGALDNLFNASKPGVRQSAKIVRPLQRISLRACARPSSSTKPRTPTTARDTIAVENEASPKLDAYFDRPGANPKARLNRSGRISPGGTSTSHGRKSLPLSPTSRRTVGQKHPKPLTREPTGQDAGELIPVRPNLPSSRGTAVLPSSPKRVVKPAESFLGMSSSSPVPSGPSHTEASLNQEVADGYVLSSSWPSPSHALPVAAQRMHTRRRNVLPPSIPEYQAATVPTMPPIESFFKPQKLRSRNQSNEEVEVPVIKPKKISNLPREMSAGLRPESFPSKLAIKSRESLPGTWKAVAAHDRIARSARAHLRVSIVDLRDD